MPHPYRRLLVTFALLGTVAFAQPNPPRTLAELQTEIERLLQEAGTPGVSVALVSHNRIEWVTGVGVADLASKRPATAQTLFRIGSISKEFVALAALKLQEEGKLKLTDPVRAWLPECPIENPWEATDPVRLVHLLEHTSGVPNGRGISWAHNDPKPVTMAEALALEPENRYVHWRPGSRSSYSNYGTTLAAAVIEKVAGQRFEDYVRDNFFGPLGMKTASYFLTSDADRASNYRRGVPEPLPYWHTSYRPAGGISASAEDMANYLLFHLQRGRFGGRQLLAEASMDRLERPGTLPAVQAGIATGYGLFNETTFVRGYEEHGHNGNVWGALALFGYIPELGVGRAIMINNDNGKTALRIWEAVGNYLLRDVPPAPLPPAVPLSAELQRSLPGYYVDSSVHDSDYLDLFVYYESLRRVAADAQGLAFRVLLGNRPVRWIPVSENLFRRETASRPTLALVRGEDGETLLQDDRRTFRRISPLRAWIPPVGFVVSSLLALTSLLFAVVWGLRRLLGWLPAPGPWSVRLWPLLGAAALFGCIAFYVAGRSRGYPFLGVPNRWTIGIMLTSLLIPVATLGSVVAVWRHRRAAMNRFAYWHAVLVTAGLVFITGFMLSWGLVGVRMWK